MKKWIFVLLVILATNVSAVQVNVKCQDDEVIFATDKKTNLLKGAYVCSKQLSVPIAIVKDENFDNKLDMQDSISFYISKKFTVYKKILSKKFDNFEQELNEHFQASGEKDAYFKIDFENLYDAEEIKAIFEKVRLSKTNVADEVQSSQAISNEEFNELTFRKRYYDPRAGRFLSEDPKGFAAGDPNLYRYVENNPINFTDPSGLATYRCSYPILGGLTQHDYLCVDGICDGLAPGEYPSTIGALIPQEGTYGGGPSPSEGGTCKEASKKKCVDDCVLAEFARPKPNYNIWNGQQCQSFANNVLSKCMQGCK